ncbi:MAG: DUF4261 domain-containing protein [Anaerolineae bacterium]|nr:DUF4261 domain-containing protein [Anaerolineae bacterium]
MNSKMPETQAPYSAVLVLLFDSLPFINQSTLQKEIDTLQHGSSLGIVSLDMTVNETNGLFGNVYLGSHNIQLVGIAAPYPDLGNILQSAHLRPDQKQVLSGHRAHVICYYQQLDTSGVDQFIALYSLAFALRKYNLRGVANPLTWMCQSVDMLPSLLTSGFLESFKESPAASMMLWLGFIRFHKSNTTVWFATKGSPLFGVPDFAYLGKSSENEAVLDMFGDVFTYIYRSGAKLGVGHTMQLGENSYLRFSNVTEYADYLGDKTLVIEKISASNINKHP